MFQASIKLQRQENLIISASEIQRHDGGQVPSNRSYQRTLLPERFQGLNLRRGLYTPS